MKDKKTLSSVYAVICADAQTLNDVPDVPHHLAGVTDDFDVACRMACQWVTSSRNSCAFVLRHDALTSWAQTGRVYTGPGRYRPVLADDVLAQLSAAGYWQVLRAVAELGDDSDPTNTARC